VNNPNLKGIYNNQIDGSFKEYVVNNPNLKGIYNDIDALIKENNPNLKGIYNAADQRKRRIWL
jgi:hypothetical protein